MKKLFLVILAVTAIFVLVASPAFAGGGQNCETNRGEAGQGAVVQTQVQDPPPFQP